MEYTLAHTFLTVKELDRTIAFYRQALGLRPVRRLHPADQDIELVFLQDGRSKYELEIGCPAGLTEPVKLGDNPIHLAFSVPDMAVAHALHESMGVIVQDNPEVEVYFIQDPDGYRIEIIPENPKEPVGWEYISE